LEQAPTHQHNVSLLCQLSSKVTDPSSETPLEEQPAEILILADMSGLIISAEVLKDAYDQIQCFHNEFLPPRRAQAANALVHALYSECGRLLLLDVVLELP